MQTTKVFALASILAVASFVSAAPLVAGAARTERPPRPERPDHSPAAIRAAWCERLESRGGEYLPYFCINEEPTPEPEPEPEPTPTTTSPSTIDHIVISEVLYDLANDGSQGSESGGDNEWVELYNPTHEAVDLMNWQIGDGSSNDVITETSLSVAAGERMVITNATTTANFWNFASVSVVYLDSSISGGLANAGDSVRLFNADGEEVDAVSYGSNISVFDPSVSGGSDGESIGRIGEEDTDTAADWAVHETPTPGE